MLNPTFFSDAGGRWRRPGETATRARWRSWRRRSRRAATRGPQVRRLSRPGERLRRDVGAVRRRGRGAAAHGRPRAAGGGGAAGAGVVRARGAAAHGRRGRGAAAHGHGAALGGRWRRAVGGRREKEEGGGD